MRLTTPRVAGFVTALVVVYLGGMYRYCYSPVRDSVPTARQHANDLGYSTWGYYGDILDEPDVAGGCTVRIGFTDATRRPAEQVYVTLRRYWAFGGWHALGHETKEWADQPARQAGGR